MIKIILESPDATTFRVEAGGELSGPLKLSYQTIYSLESAIPIAALTQGVSWDIPPEALERPPAFELMLHAAYLRVVYSFWPKCSPRSPFGARDLPTNFQQHYHMLRNVGILNDMSHVQALAGAAKGSDVIIAMPGPSLDPEFIRAHQDRCVVIGSGRAIRTLVEAGVRPDLYWIQDTHPPSWQVILDGLDGPDRPGGLAVVNPAGPIADHQHRFDQIYKAWNFLGFETDRFEKIEEIPPSSATGAYSIALLMGAKTITFTGCDSGARMTPDQAETFPENASNLLDGNPLCDPENKQSYARDIYLRHGKTLAVRTQSNYLACAQWLKSRAMRDRLNHQLEVFDVSETGMLTFNSVIEHANQAPLKNGVKHFRPARFDHRNDSKPFIAEMLKNYRMVQKYLRPEELVPGLALKPPFNCIFFGMDQTMNERFAPTREHYETAVERLELIIETLSKIESQ